MVNSLNQTNFEIYDPYRIGGVLNMKFLGSGGYSDVYSGCEDSKCQYGYAIKNIGITDERYDDLDNVLTQINERLLQGQTPHLTYTYKILNATVSPPQSFVLPREEWPNYIINRYKEMISEMDPEYVKNYEDELIDRMIDKFFPIIYQVKTIFSELGLYDLGVLFKMGTLTREEFLSLMFGMFHGQYTLGLIGYAHPDNNTGNQVILPLTYDTYFEYHLLDDIFYVPTYGRRLAWIDYDEVVPVEDTKYKIAYDALPPISYYAEQGIDFDLSSPWQNLENEQSDEQQVKSSDLYQAFKTHFSDPPLNLTKIGIFKDY